MNILTHPVAQLPEIRAYREARMQYDRAHRIKYGSAKRGLPAARESAEVELRAAAKRVEEVEALLEIGKATEADLEAARSAQDALKRDLRRDLEAETRRQRRKATVQLQAISKDLHAARQSVQSAHREIIADDVRELADLLAKAIEVNARIQAAEDAMTARLPHRIIRYFQLPSDTARQISKWLDRAASLHPENVT